MNQKQLEYFLTVYEEGSIQAAADKLYISRQGVSKLIRQLEGELAQPLFVRHKDGIVPTDFAQTILPHVQRLLNEYSCIQGMQTLASQHQYVVRIAALDHLLGYLGAEFLLAFHEAYPDIILSVTDMTDEGTMRALQAGTCDFALVNGPFDERLFQGVPLFFIHYCVRLHKNHLLAQKSSLTVEDLEGETIVGKGRSYECFRTKLDTYVLSRGIRLRILAETSDERLLAELAARKEAIILEYDYTAKQYPNPDLVTRPFSMDTDGQTVYLLWKKDVLPPKSSRQFRQFLEHWVVPDGSVECR